MFIIRLLFQLDPLVYYSISILIQYMNTFSKEYETDVYHNHLGPQLGARLRYLFSSI